MTGPEPRACRTCRRVLARWTGPAGERYLHNEELRGETVDHPAVPAPLAEVPGAALDCDFCSAPGPRYRYPTTTVLVEPRVVVERTVGLADYQARHRAARTRSTRTEDGIVQHLGQAWSACHDCAALIDTRDLYGLVRRVLDAMPAKARRGKRLIEARGRLIDLYERLFASLGQRMNINSAKESELTYIIDWTEVSNHRRELSAEELACLLDISPDELSAMDPSDIESRLPNALGGLDDDGFLGLTREGIQVGRG